MPLVVINSKEDEIKNFDLKYFIFDADDIYFQDNYLIEVVSEPKNGLIETNNKIINYIPNPNFYGTDIAQIKVIDKIGLESRVSTFIFKIQSVDDIVESINSSFMIHENMKLFYNLPPRDLLDDMPIVYFFDNQINKLTKIFTYGTVTIFNNDNNWLLQYSPNQIYEPYEITEYVNEVISFNSYDGNDDNIYTNNEFNITILNIPIKPILSNINFYVNEDEILLVDIVKFLVNDVNDPFLEDTYILDIISYTSHGILEIKDYKYIKYIPNENYNGSDNFQIKVLDEDGLSSNIANIEIIIFPVNDVLESLELNFNIYENRKLIYTLPRLDLKDNEEIHYSFNNSLNYVLEKTYNYGIAKIELIDNNWRLIYIPNKITDISIDYINENIIFILMMVIVIIFLQKIQR